MVLRQNADQPRRFGSQAQLLVRRENPTKYEASDELTRSGLAKISAEELRNSCALVVTGRTWIETKKMMKKTCSSRWRRASPFSRDFVCLCNNCKSNRQLYVYSTTSYIPLLPSLVSYLPCNQFVSPLCPLHQSQPYLSKIPSIRLLNHRRGSLRAVLDREAF